MSDPRLYELRITATGAVRDADGNVLGEPAVKNVTEEELKAHLESDGGSSTTAIRHKESS